MTDTPNAGLEGLVAKLRTLADDMARMHINGFGNRARWIADELESLSLPGAEGDARDAKILLLASEMLDEYSDRLGNDGCNDWDWPENWTPEDRALFLAKFHKHNRSQPRDIEDWGDTLGNSSVAYTLAQELKDTALASRRELGGVAL